MNISVLQSVAFLSYHGCVMLFIAYSFFASLPPPSHWWDCNLGTDTQFRENFHMGLKGQSIPYYTIWDALVCFRENWDREYLAGSSFSILLAMSFFYFLISLFSFLELCSFLVGRQSNQLWIKCTHVPWINACKCFDDSRRQGLVRVDADLGRKKINEARKTAIAENMAISGAKWLICKPREYGNIIPRLLPVTKCSHNARWPPRKESCLGRVRLQENSLLTNRIFPYYQKKNFCAHG